MRSRVVPAVLIELRLSSVRQKGSDEELWPLLGFTVGTMAGVFIAPFVACLVFTADFSGFRELRKISIF